MMKKRNKRGFTLAELLIVVAIIAVLVAISIPVFTANLEKSREAVDISNMRSARALLSAEYMSGSIHPGSLIEYYYDGGRLTLTKPTKGYGKSSTKDGKTKYTVGNGCLSCDYNSEENRKDDYLVASVGLDGKLHVHWVHTNIEVESALPAFHPEWISWTKTDSRGSAGVKNRADVLKALGLSDNHEYTITTTDSTGKYTLYVYTGNFPDAAVNNKAQKDELDKWLDYKESKVINVSAYEYDPKTGKTENLGRQQAKAVLRSKDSNTNYWIQIQKMD